MGHQRLRAEAGKNKRLRRIKQMQAQGKTIKEIAEKLDIHPSTVSRTLNWGNERARFHGSEEEDLGPDPIPIPSLPEDISVLTNWSKEAFKAFFLRYSGFAYFPRHHEDIADLVFDNQATLVTIPPRHAKSEIWAVWFPIWNIARNRNIQIILVSKTHDQAMKHARKVGYILERNDRLVKDFGRFRPSSTDMPWRPNRGELMVEGRQILTESGDLTLQVRGSGSGILGMAAHIIVADDVANPENSSRQTERDNLFEWFYGEVLSRLEPEPTEKLMRALTLGTRFHAQDLYGALEQVQYEDVESDTPVRVWKVHKMQAVTDWEKREVLWPERFSFEYFQRQRAHDPSLFEAVYQQNPLARGAVLAQPEWIYGGPDGVPPGCVDKGRTVGEGLRKLSDGALYGQTGLIPVVRVLSIDPSPTQYAGIVIADVPFISPIQQDRNFYAHILESKRERMGPREMVQEIERVWKMYGPLDYLIFERAAAQRWFFSDPEMQMWMRRMRVIPHDTGMNKHNPEYGVLSLAGDIEMARISIPYADASSRVMAEPLIEEMTTYPQGRYDDILMALWFIKVQHPNLVPVVNVPTNQPRGKGNPGLPDRLRKGYSWQRRSNRWQ